MIVGLITFPLFYWLEIKWIGNYYPLDIWASGLMVLLFIITAFIAMYYYVEIKRFKRVLHFYFFMKRETKNDLLNLRDEILVNFEIARSLTANT